jgi:hypothetical protein
MIQHENINRGSQFRFRISYHATCPPNAMLLFTSGVSNIYSVTQQFHVYTVTVQYCT